MTLWSRSALFPIECFWRTPLEANLLSSLFNRSDYPTLTNAIYLNQASLGLIGQPAVTAMHGWLDNIGRHGNLYLSDDDEGGLLDTLRVHAARLFETEAKRVAVLSSASELLSQIPLILRPPKGTKVLSVSSDFPAITRPWLRLAEQQAYRLEFVDDNPESDLTDDLTARIDDQTFLIAVSHVQYATGTLIDIPRLGEASAEAGSRLVVDATQSTGALQTGIESWGADAVVSSGYKWLGGHGGVAVAVLGSEFLREVPAMPGWMGAPNPFEFDPTQVLFADDARRYTQSTMSYVSVAGLTAAIDQILTNGVLKIQNHAERLAQMLIELVEPHDWHPFRHLGDPAASPHIISLRGRDNDQQAVAERLRTANIVCSSRSGRLRVSLAPYNDENDITAFVAALTGI